MISMKRVRSHKIEALSDAFLEKFFVDWVCNKLHKDYSLDFIIGITLGKNRETTTDINFFVQNKGTDFIKQTEKYVILDIDPKFPYHTSNLRKN